MKTRTPTTRVALAALCIALVSTPELAAKGKPPSGGGGSPPDPEIVLSKSGRNKPTDILLVNADGSNATKVYTSDLGGSFVDINRIYDELILEDRAGGSKLLHISFNVSSGGTTEGAPQVIAQNLGTIYGGDFSPDGEYLLFQTLDASVSPAVWSVYLRTTDPASGETPKMIYTGRRVFPQGVCWLHAAFPGSYKIAIHTTYPAGSDEAEVLFFEIDPTKPAAEVIPKDGLGEPAPYAVLSTVGKPFTLAAPIDSARTTESIVAPAYFREERAPNTPKGMFIQASRAIQWFADDTVAHLTPALDQGKRPLGPRLSPDDTKLLYGNDGTVVIRDLATGNETAIASSSYPHDWAPANP